MKTKSTFTQNAYPVRMPHCPPSCSYWVGVSREELQRHVRARLPFMRRTTEQDLRWDPLLDATRALMARRAEAAQ